jgi:hypothetical protein
MCDWQAVAEPFHGVQDLQHKISNSYRVRMVLDNMPITTFDLISVRPLSTVHFGDSAFYISMVGTY